MRRKERNEWKRETMFRKMDCEGRIAAFVVLFAAWMPLVAGFALHPTGAQQHRRLGHPTAAPYRAQLFSSVHPQGPKRILLRPFARRTVSGVPCSGSAVDGVVCTARESISPRQARELLEQLKRDDKWEKEAVLKVLNSMHGEGGAKPLFNSSAILFRRTSANEIQMLTRGVIKPNTIDLNGDDDMEVLNVAFYATLFSSMLLSTIASVLIPDVPNMPFLRDSVLRFFITIGFGAVPFAFLGAGLSVPGLLQAALIQVRRLISEEFRQVPISWSYFCTIIC